jgi:uronate dehydrogenase
MFRNTLSTGGHVRILVTGAAGAASGFVRPALLAAGHRLTLFDRIPVSALPGERVVRGDLTHADSVAEATEGADAVVHFGGQSHEAPWAELAASNVEGTRVVLDAAARAGVTPVLLASSMHTIGMLAPPDSPLGDPEPHPDSYYGVSKIAVEALGSLYAARCGLAVTAARTDPGYRMVAGVSRNRRGWFDLAPGRAIGYEPADDAEDFADRVGDTMPSHIGAGWTQAPLGGTAPGGHP